MQPLPFQPKELLNKWDSPSLPSGFSSPPPRRGASAILIVLALIVLITGVTLAFFSRAILERQISDSSASQEKISTFATGAIAQIEGDLKQEIVESSILTGTAVLDGTAPVPVYAPNPIVIGTTGAPYRVTGTAGGLPPNLVKISSYNQPCFIFTTGTGPNRASSASTTGTSLNGRHMSLARWNAALLLAMPATNAVTDYTPVTTGSAGSAFFSPPNWILVARNGTNPAAFSPTLINSSSNSATAVIGRYAYAIYDEGGLLDVNVAGCPSAIANNVSQPLAAMPGYKSALAFADLTQIPGLSQPVVDQIVGWRNYASSQLSGTFPALSFSLTTATNYYSAVLSNTTGFLTVNGTMSSDGQTDKVFPSRQALMSFLLEGVAGSTSTSGTLRASLQNALQYLGTFSRDLNQPSFTPNPNRPAIIDNPVNPKTGAIIGGGGNDAFGSDKSTSPANPAGDINPPFLSATCSTAFTRNDGTQAVAGEPLVKKRFALSRLAWLTCRGPIANDAGALNPANDPTIASLITIFESQYGYSPAFLAQGGPTNIFKYFGLSWVKDTRTVGSVTTGDGQSKWLYNHKNTSYLKTLSTAGGAIQRLSGVTALNREADFVELLKAALCAGSLTKGSEQTYPNGNSFWKPYDWQFQRDVHLDNAVIQVFANIIEQFKPDGYPVRVLFNNSSTNTITAEFYGVENLPYVYRVQKGMLQVHLPNPLPTTIYNNPTPSDGSGKATGAGTGGNLVQYLSPANLSDPGVGVDIVYPTLWNPYDPNSSRGAANLYPTQFRFVMDAASDPDHVDASGGATSYPNTNSVVDYAGFPGTLNVAGTTYTPYSTVSTGAATFSPLPQVINPPTWAQLYLTTPYTPAYSPAPPNSSGTANTELDFQVPAGSGTAALFSEPTALVRAGYPTGSNLTTGSNNRLLTDPVLMAYHFISTAGGVGIWSEADDPFNIAPGLPGGGTSGAAHNAAEAKRSQAYVGIESGAYPLRWVVPASSGSGSISGTVNVVETCFGNYNSPYNPSLIAILQCQDASGNWINYNVQFLSSYDVGGASIYHYCNGTPGCAMPSREQMVTAFDPRTGRFGPVATNDAADPSPNSTIFLNSGNTAGLSSTTSAYTWIGPGALQGVNATNRPDASAGFGMNADNLSGEWVSSLGWFPGNGGGQAFTATDPIRLGAFSQNNIHAGNDGALDSVNAGAPGVGSAGHAAQYYADADGVVRRAMGAYVPCSLSPAQSAATTIGLPMARTMPMISGGSTPPAFQSQSRPMMLHRPFRSVAELGYVFSGTPWKNLDFFTPGSGDSALLDVFCINDTSDPNGLVAGKVDLNTRQAPVLQAVLSGAYVDEEANLAASGTNTLPELTDTNSYYTSAFQNTVQTIAQNLVARTTLAPLANVADLVGRYTGTTPPSQNWSSTFDEFAAYAGFTGNDPLSPNPADTLPTLNQVPLFAPSSTASPSSPVTAMGNIQRFRETPIRALANVGTTRVWNLMIDLVAQTGRYPNSASNINNFTVEGEKRYWAHIAIDRCTGQVIDKQIEVVKE